LAEATELGMYDDYDDEESESKGEGEGKTISVDKGKSPEVSRAEHTATIKETPHTTTSPAEHTTTLREETSGTHTATLKDTPEPVKSSSPKNTLLFADIPALAELNLTVGAVQEIIASYVKFLEHKIITNPPSSEEIKTQQLKAINS